jgi:hypothetical protein
MYRTECDKESYSKHGAEAVRKNLYGKRKIKLRIYQCDKCHQFHFTSRIDTL